VKIRWFHGKCRVDGIRREYKGGWVQRFDGVRLLDQKNDIKDPFYRMDLLIYRKIYSLDEETQECGYCQGKILA
jgi:hypothetical protein